MVRGWYEDGIEQVLPTGDKNSIIYRSKKWQIDISYLFL